MTECSDCMHRERIPGNAHISCSNPPSVVATVKGQVKKKQAKEVLKKVLEDRAEGEEVIIKKKWQGCGIFPLNFDESTILACSNKEEEDE